MILHKEIKQDLFLLSSRVQTSSLFSSEVMLDKHLKSFVQKEAARCTPSSLTRLN